MFQIKQIIETRINDILELQSMPTNHHHHPSIDSPHSLQQAKSQLLLKFKRIEEFRESRQTQLLAQITLYSLNDQNVLQEVAIFPYPQLYSLILDLFKLYDNKFSKYCSEQIYQLKEQLKLILQQFFRRHHFKEKLKFIEQTFKKDLYLISADLLLGWICEWSKKIYNLAIREENSKNFQLSPTNQNYRTSTHRKIQNIQKQFQSMVHIPQLAPDYTILFTRVNTYSYMLDEIQSYYKMLGISDLDHQYLKHIRKRYTKSNILHKDNLNKIIQIMMEVPQNKSISSTIKDYQRQYLTKFTTTQEKKTLSEPKRKKIQFGEKKIKNKATTESTQKTPIKISIHSKEILPQLPKLAEVKEKKNQLYEKIKSMKMRKLMKLPQISVSRSVDKEAKPQLIRFPTHMQNSQPVQHNAYYPFSVRNSQKNIGAKKLYSLKRPTENEASTKKLKVEECFSPAYQEENQGKFHLEYRPKYQLYTIREKSKALLKNYKAIKRYN